jgi:hypothetical protein
MERTITLDSAEYPAFALVLDRIKGVKASPLPKSPKAAGLDNIQEGWLGASTPNPFPPTGQPSFRRTDMSTKLSN